MKKWTHLSNTTDEMLITWSNSSALRKLQWLEDVRLFYKAAVPKKIREFNRDVLRKR